MKKATKEQSNQSATVGQKKQADGLKGYTHRLPASDLTALKICAARRGVTVKELFSEALSEWMAKNGVKPEQN